MPRCRIHTYYDWDWASAEQEFQRSLQLNPNDAAVRHRYSRYLSTVGRIDDALREIRRAQELDPLSQQQGSQIRSHSLGCSFYRYSGTYRSASVSSARERIFSRLFISQPGRICEISTNAVASKKGGPENRTAFL